MQISNFSDAVIMTGQGSPTGSGTASARSAQLQTYLKNLIGSGNAAGQINTWYDAERSLAGGGYIATITGTPTGGTLTLAVTTGNTYTGANNGAFVAANAQTTGTIAYNASAATVQAALQALSNVGTGNATVTGSAGGPYTITFANSLGAVAVALGTNALTGGTSPNVTIANTQIPDAATAPTFGSASTTGGTLAGSSTIYAVYAYKNANGETKVSIEASYSVPAGTNTNTITLTAPALPSGATGINVYVGSTSGNEAFVGTSAGNTYVITALPAAGAATPPNYNRTTLTTETIDLTSLTDANGAALTLKGVSCIHIENWSPTSPMVVFGGGSFAGPLSSASNTLIIPPAVLQPSGVYIPSMLHLPAYMAGGAWKVIGGVNNNLRIGTFDPAGTTYGIILPGVQ